MHTTQDDPPGCRSMTLMLASVVLFAANTLAIRAVSLHFPAADAWLASFFRGIIGLTVVFALYGRGRGLQPERLFSNKLIMLRGVIGGLTIIVFYITIVKLGAARAVILSLTYPVFGTIIAAVWLKERISRASMIWMLAGLGGLAIFLSDDGKLLSPSKYDLLAIAGAVAAGWVVVIIRKLRNEEHPSTIYASQALLSLAISAPAAVKLPHIPAAAWFGLGFAAVVVAFGQLIMTRAYQTMSVAKGSAIQMLLPIVTGIGGFLCFGETFHLREIIGAALALLATWRVVAAK
jgi:drug/metabolite transporter (DMT)-like permease